MTKVQVYGAVLAVIGLALRYWMNRRRFNRNNFAGVQEFRNYEHKVAAQGMERLVKLVGAVLVIGGVFLYLVEVVNKKFAQKYREEKIENHDKKR